MAALHSSASSSASRVDGAKPVVRQMRTPAVLRSRSTSSAPWMGSTSPAATMPRTPAANLAVARSASWLSRSLANTSAFDQPIVSRTTACASSYRGVPLRRRRRTARRRTRPPRRRRRAPSCRPCPGRRGRTDRSRSYARLFEGVARRSPASRSCPAHPGPSRATPGRRSARGGRRRRRGTPHTRPPSDDGPVAAHRRACAGPGRGVLRSAPRRAQSRTVRRRHGCRRS